MADTAADPPKDKVKKKKSSTKKSDAPKEKALETPAASPESAAVAPSEKPPSRKPSAVESAPELSTTLPELSAAPPELSNAPPELSADPPELSNAPPELSADPPELSATTGAEVEQKPATPQRRQSENVPRKEKKAGNLLEELDEEKMIELKEAFQLFDLDGDGFIDLPDLRLTFASLGRPEVTDEELREMLSEAKNPMDFDSFVMLLGFKTIALDPEETLRDALSAWDMRNTGLIPQERITHDLMTRGDKFNKDEAHGAFEDAPRFITDGEQMIDYISFCRTLGGLRKANTTADDN